MLPSERIRIRLAGLIGKFFHFEVILHHWGRKPEPLLQVFVTVHTDICRYVCVLMCESCRPELRILYNYSRLSHAHGLYGLQAIRYLVFATVSKL